MAKKPYKYRQARKDAKAAAKKAFPGKVKAVRKDITGKITAEDRLALKDMADTAKKELGKKAYLSRAEYDAMQSKELEKFRESMREEFGEYAGKKAGEEEKPAKKKPAKKAAAKAPAAAVTDRRTPAEKTASKKAAAKEVKKNTKKFVQKGSKAVVDTPVTKGGELEKKLTGGKRMTRAEKSAANKAAWKNMSPAERKNWSASKPGATGSGVPAKDSGLRKSLGVSTDKWSKMTQAEKEAAVKDSAKASNAKEKTRMANAEARVKARQEARTTATKRPTLADLKRNEAKGLEEAKARVAAKNKALADSAKGKTQTPQAVEAKKKAAVKPEVKTGGKNAPKKFAKTRAVGKGGAYAALAGEVVSLAKGSTKKDFDEINRLENKLAMLTGKGKSRATAGRQGAQMQASNLAALATMGVVGKTRRQRMDELNRLIAKAEKKNAPKQLRYGKDGSSLVPGTAAYKAGSTTRPTVTSTGGGSTTKVDSSKYTVKKGDTLSGIAKNAGVSLSEIRAANPEIMKKKKYKQGSMIWSGTKVNIPKK
jgi:LysM repeat protein